MARKKTSRIDNSKIRPPAEDRHFTVIRDTREQQGWVFAKSAICNGTLVKGLKSGDYSLEGIETIFAIERKRNTAEFAQNILEKRFEAEMVRLEVYPESYLLLEFTLHDLMNWPLNSGLPSYIQKKTRISKNFLMKRFMDFQTQYNTKIMLVGSHGKEIALSLFKRMYDKYLNPKNQASETSL